MNKTNKYLILIFLLVVSAIVLYFVTDAGGNDAASSQDFEGISGEVVNTSLSARLITIETSSGDEFNFALTEDTKIFNLYNRETTLQEIETGYIVNGEGDQTDDSSMIVSKVDIVDTDSDYEITIHDRDKTFTYSSGEQFSVILNDNMYPFANFECSQNGIINNISDNPGANPPFYAAEFETVSSGECELTNKDFSVMINVE